MKICTVCGREIEPDQLICEYCQQGISKSNLKRLKEQKQKQQQLIDSITGLCQEILADSKIETSTRQKAQEAAIKAHDLSTLL